MPEEINSEIEERKKKLVSFLKNKTTLIVYTILAFIVFLGVFIRTRNISKLKDITTGSWTLGPDLDPFLFLRWAEYIVEHGKLFALDTMRNVPLADFCSGANCIAIDTARESWLLPYLIAYFHKFLSIFELSNDITYSAIIFPVFMFALTTIAFFLFARKIFYQQSSKFRNSVALISTLIFVLVPSILPRTIAGIPEKESVAFLFMFLAFYFFLEAFTSEKLKKGILFGVLAGISTALMALIWGGVLFIFFTIPVSVFLAFLFGKVQKKEFYVYSSWMFVYLLIVIPLSEKFNIISTIGSVSTGSGIAIFFIIGFSLFFIFKNKKIMEIGEKTRLPATIFAVISSFIIMVILASFFFGPGFIFDRIGTVKQQLVSPLEDRFTLTVAENKQPYFTTDWKGSFGPILFNIPLLFWLFFVGSVVLFNNMIEKLSKREKLILTFGYFIFLFCLIFSRYSPDSVLNGTNFLSQLVYFGGILFFLGSFGYLGLKRKYPQWIGYYIISIISSIVLSIFYTWTLNNIFSWIFLPLLLISGIIFTILTLTGLNAYSEIEFNFAYILYFIILTLGITGARTAIRLVMVLGAVLPVVVGFLIVKIGKKFLNSKDETRKLFIGAIAILIILASIFTIWTYYQSDKSTAEVFAPSAYQWQWQTAMSWVRENTPSDAVFAHWWDYGYWVQSLGERATILDGGNALVYWDHLMGRHVLTGTDEIEALKFLYAHNATHLLIDSTDIGKYSAFSSIGSNENYDRLSWINTFLIDDSQTQESKNSTNYIYRGGSANDEDISWNQEENSIFLPAQSSVIGAIILNINSKGQISQPLGIFVYAGQQYQIPLRYLYYKEGMMDFEEGIDAGVFIYPRLDLNSEGGISKNEIGAAFYLSKRTVHSELARLYLFNEQTNYFKLVHNEKNLLISDVERQGLIIGDFVYYQGFQGPIKIWEINYPLGIQSDPKYLELDYPNENLWKVNSGEN